MQIKIKRVTKTAVIPSQKGGAYVVYANLPGMGLVVEAQSTSLIHTGISISVPSGYSLQVETDAQTAYYKNLVVLGKTENDELTLVVRNLGQTGLSLSNGDVVGQFRFVKTETFELSENPKPQKTKK